MIEKKRKKEGEKPLENERKPRKKRCKPRQKWAVFGLLVALFVTWFVWQQESIDAETYTVQSAELPAAFDGLRIVQVSDLHGKEFGENSARLLNAVAELRPDLIAITGDLIDRESQMEMLPALTKGLAAIAPTYYVTGNHEWSVEWSGSEDAVRRLKELLSDCGVVVLSNEYVLLERGGSSVVLAGIDDPNGYADQKTPEELYGEIKEEYPDSAVLLLAHRNDAIERYAAAGYDIVLSGHGHGGIIRPPFTDGLFGVDRTLFPTWTAGEYQVGDTVLFVSRGLGNNTVPVHGFRLFNRPHLPLVILSHGT